MIFSRINQVDYGTVTLCLVCLGKKTVVYFNGKYHAILKVFPKLNKTKLIARQNKKLLNETLTKGQGVYRLS